MQNYDLKEKKISIWFWIAIIFDAVSNITVNSQSFVAIVGFRINYNRFFQLNSQKGISVKLTGRNGKRSNRQAVHPKTFAFSISIPKVVEAELNFHYSNVSSTLMRSFILPEKYIEADTDLIGIKLSYSRTTTYCCGNSVFSYMLCLYS